MSVFERAWSVVKSESGDLGERVVPTWGHIWAAGLANEAGDLDELARLINLLDDMGHSYSAERKAVDLMINSDWSVEATKARMGRTQQGTRPDTAIKRFLNPLPPGEVLMDDSEDEPGVVGQKWRITDDDEVREYHE
jgi:hypothetical protein